MSAEKLWLVYENVDGNLAKEFVWASKVPSGWKIDDIPFFAKNVAVDGVVTVEAAEGGMYFDELVSESGNSTLQVVVLDERVALETIDKLVELGCDWEGYGEKNLYLAVNVPSQINYLQVKEYLESALSIGSIDFRVACLSSMHKMIAN